MQIAGIHELVEPVRAEEIHRRADTDAVIRLWRRPRPFLHDIDEARW